MFIIIIIIEAETIIIIIIIMEAVEMKLPDLPVDIKKSWGDQLHR